MDAYYGITLEGLAEITAKEGELRVKHGQEGGRAAFRSYLAERGHTESDWANAHNTWLERFRADPTGQLEARFHHTLGALAQKAHFGDVRDMSQDQLEGVTLEKYAQLSVLMAKPGVDADALAREHGLAGADAWVKANAAWGAKMGADTTFKLATQYGALYQKYAGPQFAEQQMAATAAILAESNKPREPRDLADAPKKDLSQATLLAKLRSESRDDRWEAARWLAHQWKKNDPSTQVNLECIPVLIDILEHHDEHTASKAADAAQKLTSDLEQYTDAVKWSIGACLTRAKEKLATLETAFAPIRDQAVPERVFMQSRIQDFQGLVRDLEGVLARWPAPQAHAVAAVPSNSSGARVAPRASSGPPKFLFAIPVLVVGAIIVWKVFGGAHAPAASASTPADTSSAKADVAPAAPVAPTASAPAAPHAAAPHAGAKGAPKKAH
jgi:hypothetical protein